MAVFDDNKICARCGKHKDEHTRDWVDEEWDCPTEPNPIPVRSTNMLQTVEVCSCCDKVMGTDLGTSRSNDLQAFTVNVKVCSGCRTDWTQEKQTKVLAAVGKLLNMMSGQYHVHEQTKAEIIEELNFALEEYDDSAHIKKAITLLEKL